jgi:hypothetical protein
VWGGLALFWDDGVEITIQNFSRWHINVVISPRGGGLQWKFTGFYGHPDASKKHEAWSTLKYMVEIDPPVPWLSVGDFNEIADLSEKFGGAGKASGQMINFRDSGSLCLIGLGCSGPHYTWNNGQEGEAFTRET